MNLSIFFTNTYDADKRSLTASSISKGNGSESYSFLKSTRAWSSLAVLSIERGVGSPVSLIRIIGIDFG